MTSACRRVLVVEDDPVINQTVSDRLEAEGYDVVRAWDGPGAVAAYGEHSPHLVVLDVMLHGYDGHEVCRRIQADRPVPVLMLTARAEDADVLVGLGDLRVDAAARRVWRGSEEVRLTATEFDLLLCLATTPGAVVSRDRLMAEVWGWPGASRHAHRRQPRQGPARQVGVDRIRTVHGVGYALETWSAE